MAPWDKLRGRRVVVLDDESGRLRVVGVQTVTESVVKDEKRGWVADRRWKVRGYGWVSIVHSEKVDCVGGVADHDEAIEAGLIVSIDKGSLATGWPRWAVVAGLLEVGLLVVLAIPLIVGRLGNAAGS